MDLGRVGVWTPQLDFQPAARAGEVAGELEALGFGAIWIPEVAGRDPLVHAALLLGATSSIVLATGIANVYGRDALAMASGHKTLTEAFPERFLLGLGVSHAPAVEGLRGQEYKPGLTMMREYLAAMDAAPYFALAPSTEPRRVLAALGPKMLALSAEHADGAHPYFVPVEHTAQAREILGPDKWLMPEQKVVLETDPTRAREIARAAMAVYLTLPNYTNNLRRLGWTEEDIANGGSDALVDAIVVWGDEATIRARVVEHLDAGASHVCIQVVTDNLGALPLEQWRRLAPALVGS